MTTELSKVAPFVPIACIVGIALACPVTAIAEDRVLYQYSTSSVFDGDYGPIAHAQVAIEAALQSCGAPTSLGTHGWFGPMTRNAIRRLALCPAIAPKIPHGSAATQGALTEALWSAILPSPPPDLAARARSLMLSFESTDYTRAEWNFCQNRPLYDPVHGQPVCYSGDRKSYLTWGPNGATAGHGREVQTVLVRVQKVDPGLIASSFGNEAVAVARLLELPEAGRATETYMCGIWATPARREAWHAGFRTYGGSAVVRTAYDELYRSANFDGGKIAAFNNAYANRGLKATEVDFAFFTDRAAHTSVSYTAVFQALTLGLSNAAARRRIAQSLPAANPDQRVDRLGRDVAFYADAFAIADLKPAERDAWKAMGHRLASDVGLSDARVAPGFKPGPAIPFPTSSGTLTPAETDACPAAILASQRPPPH